MIYRWVGYLSQDSLENDKSRALLEVFKFARGWRTSKCFANYSIQVSRATTLVFLITLNSTLNFSSNSFSVLLILHSSHKRHPPTFLHAHCLQTTTSIHTMCSSWVWKQNLFMPPNWPRTPSEKQRQVQSKQAANPNQWCSGPMASPAAGEMRYSLSWKHKNSGGQL